MNTMNRAAAATVAVLAALTLAVTVPATVDAGSTGGSVQIAKIKGAVGPAEALVAPGQPPAPCTPGRYKCPLGSGAL